MLLYVPQLYPILLYYYFLIVMLNYVTLLVPIVKHEFKVDNSITASLARFVKQFEVMIVADNNQIHQYNINMEN